jgi:hypothetical protein
MRRPCGSTMLLSSIDFKTEGWFNNSLYVGRLLGTYNIKAEDSIHETQTQKTQYQN